MKTHEIGVIKKSKTQTLLLGGLGFVLLVVWLLLTPAGLEGKSRAAGFSVCHQIAEHTIQVGDKLLPLCARCTGTFSGLLMTILYFSRSGRRGGFPSKAKSTILILFFLIFTADGVNSALSLINPSLPLYPPDNRIRLATGLLFGASLANLVMPLWNQTLWKETNEEPLLHSWKQFAILILLVTVVWGLIIAQLPFLYFPIAIFSTSSIFVILSVVYSLLWCIIQKKENTLQRYSDGTRIFIAGIITAILQVGVMDLVRYFFTGTWNSLTF